MKISLVCSLSPFGYSARSRPEGVYASPPTLAGSRTYFYPLRVYRVYVTETAKTGAGLTCPLSPLVWCRF
ncbi:hypothetical protein PCC6912_00160 [Chlorogloeopsis fritschii PCC 6912]|uniref:Uncharacterized protein n=1 Tax=Chlorogloeopsis fritschii PCC 6912 TaxID=211165 RepID=A0A3S0Y1Y1_CHLFR|nr:hypothetical protein PCC6912_00160 [Chlorogloeopsis fritschii PCC 6912]